MTALSRQARDTIKWWADGATIIGYVRHFCGPEGKWDGDSCGCIDDRCIGYHHDETEECGCLEAWLSDYYRDALAPSWFTLLVSGVGDGWLRVPAGEQAEAAKFVRKPEAELAATSWRRAGYVVEVREVFRTQPAVVNH